MARAKEEKARQATFAKKLDGEAHGMASFMVRADVATIALIDAGVTGLAKRLAEQDQAAGSNPETDDVRRVRAAALLLGRPLPDEADVPPVQATLMVHLSGQPPQLDAEGRPVPRVARVEGHGPVTEDWLRTVLGGRARFVVRPVLDPLGQSPVDAYEIPALHRRAVQVLTPADCFPWGSALSTAAQPLELDHTVRYDHGPPGGVAPPGQSRVGNYGPLTRSHHRIKTFAAWAVQQPFPGIFIWRDPHGAFYLVDHTGTRRVDSHAGADLGPPSAKVVVHLHHTRHDLRLADDYAAA